MNTPLVSIIIVNWNGLQWLKGCLPTIEKQTYANREIIIVDNASTDGSVAWIQKQYPSVLVIENDINKGYAEGNNIGYEHAKGKYIVFLNNDTKMAKEAVSELVSYCEANKDVGCVQSKIILMDDEKRLDAYGAFLTPTGFLYHYGFNEKDAKEYEKEIEVYSAKGACMMFSTEVLKEIEVEGKVFDERFFAYFEETDVCHRVWLIGKRIVVVPSSIIYHKVGATSSAMNNAFIQYHSFKNRMNTYLKNFEWKTICWMGILHMGICLGIIVIVAAKGNWGLVRGIAQSVWWNGKQLKATLRKRKIVQESIRKVSDRMIMNKVMKCPTIAYYYNTFKMSAMS